MFPCRFPETLDGARSGVMVHGEAVPPLATDDGPTERGRAAATHYIGRSAGLDRLRSALNAAEIDEVAAERGVVRGPDFAHGLHIFIGAGSTLAEVDAQRIEFRLQVSRAQAENEPSP